MSPASASLGSLMETEHPSGSTLHRARVVCRLVGSPCRACTAIWTRRGQLKARTHLRPSTLLAVGRVRTNAFTLLLTILRARAVEAVGRDRDSAACSPVNLLADTKACVSILLRRGCSCSAVGRARGGRTQIARVCAEACGTRCSSGVHACEAVSIASRTSSLLRGKRRTLWETARATTLLSPQAQQDEHASDAEERRACWPAAQSEVQQPASAGLEPQRLPEGRAVPGGPAGSAASARCQGRRRVQGLACSVFPPSILGGWIRAGWRHCGRRLMRGDALRLLCACAEAERTPVWLMRQAGRYMAAFRA